MSTVSLGSLSATWSPIHASRVACPLPADGVLYRCSNCTSCQASPSAALYPSSLTLTDSSCSPALLCPPSSKAPKAVLKLAASSTCVQKLKACYRLVPPSLDHKYFVLKQKTFVL